MSASDTPIIAVDAMGGDFAPQHIVEGAVLAVRERQIPVILVGQEDKINAELKRLNATQLSHITIRHADDIIEMHDKPATAVRKKPNSSLCIACDLVKRKEANAVISAGNSGGMLAAAILKIGRIHHVIRPAIASLIPTLSGKPVCLLDMGANTECTPEILFQFGLMGHVFVKQFFQTQHPKIAILANGSEASKGNELTRAAQALFEKANSMNYFGYCEGRDILKGDVDVIICDGFVGNIVLKTIEGTVDSLLKMIKQEIQSHVVSQLGALILKPSFARLKKKLDYAEYGGAPLFGIDGTVIISHGSSTPKAIKNAIFTAGKYASSEINSVLTQILEEQPTFRETEKISGQENASQENAPLIH